MEDKMEQVTQNRENELQELMKYIKGLNENTKGEIIIELEDYEKRISSLKNDIKSLSDNKMDKNEISKKVAKLR